MTLGGGGQNRVFCGDVICGQPLSKIHIKRETVLEVYAYSNDFLWTHIKREKVLEVYAYSNDFLCQSCFSVPDVLRHSTLCRPSSRNFWCSPFFLENIFFLVYPNSRMYLNAEPYHSPHIGFSRASTYETFCKILNLLKPIAVMQACWK